MWTLGLPVGRPLINLTISYTSSHFSHIAQTSWSRLKYVASIYGKRLNLLLYQFSIKHHFLQKICLKPLSPNLKYISESNKIFHYTSKVDIKFYSSKYQNSTSLEGCLLSTINPTDVSPSEQGYYKTGGKACSCSKRNQKKKNLLVFLAYLEISGKNYDKVFYSCMCT